MLNAEIKKFRLAVFVSAPDGGVSLMRALGPLNAMRRQDSRLEIALPRLDPDGTWRLSWDWVGGCDALLMCGAFSSAHCQLAVKAKMMGVPIWLDWDDDLTCVPPWNPHAHLFPPEAMRANLAMLTRIADVVTCSTEFIAERRSRTRSFQGEPIEQKISVLPNACHWPFSTAKRERRVTWRGWGNHDADLAQFIPVIKEVSQMPQFSRWKWTFVGEPGWQTKLAFPQSTPADPTPYEYDPGADGDPFLYMRILNGLRPAVHIVPLSDHPFNRARSNLAWIEGTCAGAVTIAPAWHEWEKPGVYNYTSPDHFRDMVRARLEEFSEPAAVAPAADQGRVWLQTNLMLDQVNQKRWDILNRILPDVNRQDTKRAQPAEDSRPKTESQPPRRQERQGGSAASH